MSISSALLDVSDGCERDITPLDVAVLAAPLLTKLIDASFAKMDTD